MDPTNLNNLTYILERLSPFLPNLITGKIIVGVSLALFLFYIGYNLYKKYKKKQPPKVKRPKEPKDISDRLPPHGGYIVEKLALKGHLKVGHLGMLFIHAIHLLRTHLVGHFFRYKLPWYVVVGAQDSGKSSLLEASNLDLPIGRPQFVTHGEKPGVDWWFFEHAVLLDVRGDFFIEKTGIKSLEKEWGHIGKLLRRFRGRRPLDGIILTIPADELVGKHKLSHDELAARSKVIYQKLSHLQENIGMRLPVYVFVTKSDSIVGFKSFCSEIPSFVRQQMFGWSVPYSLETAFIPAWMDEAYDVLSASVDRVKNEIFATKDQVDEGDGMLLFASEFVMTKAPLSLYLNNIFKATSYNESFFLRGLYFTGEGSFAHARDEDAQRLTEADLQSQEQERSIEETANLNQPRLIAEPTRQVVGGESLKQIYFVRDVFSSKVFREFALAKPGRHRIMLNHRMSLLARAIVALLILGLGYGIFSATKTLHVEKHKMLPVLEQIESTLKVYKQAEDAAEFSPQIEQQAHTILNLISATHSNNFFSTFFPVSWVSRLSLDIRESIAIAYDQIMLHSIYMELQKRMNDLFEEKSLTAKVASEDVGQDLSLSKLPEFIDLKRFVDHLSKLEGFIKQYNVLKEDIDVEKLPAIVSYLFNYNLPQDFIERLRSFRKYVDFKNYRPIHLSDFNENARHHFKRLYIRFLSALFNIKERYKPLVDLQDTLQNFEKFDAKESAHQGILRDILTKMQACSDFLKNKNLVWWGKKEFDPGEIYHETMTDAAKSDLIGKNGVREVKKLAQTTFELFKSQLGKFQSKVTGPFLSNDDGHVSSSTSKGLESIKNDLQSFFKEPFMEKTKAEQFSAVIPEGKQLVWDAERFDQALEMASHFQSFSSGKLRRFHPQLQEALRVAGRKYVERNIINLVAKSQRFLDVSSSSQEAEEELRASLPSYSKAAPMITKLLAKLNELSIPALYVELRDLFAIQSFSLLKKVDELLENTKPYQVKEGNFEWWDGEKGSGFKAFNVDDEQGLKSYLGDKNKVLVHLVESFSKPIVDALNNEVMIEARLNQPLLLKWTRLTEQVDAYVKKTPDNSVASLETFLSKDINDITLKNCYEKIPNDAVLQESGDYFVNKRTLIKKAILERCHSIGVKKFIQDYNAVYNFFNENISGKVPFVSVVEHVGNSTIHDFAKGEVSPDDLKRLFQLFDKIDDYSTNSFKASDALASSRRTIVNFLEQMKKIRTFFAPFIDEKQGSSMPAFDLDVEFRVNRASEVAGNVLADWILSVGDQKISYRSPKKKIRWSYGMPISLTYRWALAGSILPMTDSTQPSLDVDGYSATFKYNGKWSLFEMLHEKGVPESELAGLIDPKPYLIKSVIPMAAMGEEDSVITSSGSTQAKVFTRIKIGVPNDKSESGSGALPAFPEKAPKLVIDDDDLAKKIKQESKKQDGDDDDNDADKNDADKSDKKSDKSDKSSDDDKSDDDGDDV